MLYLSNPVPLSVSVYLTGCSVDACSERHEFAQICVWGCSSVPWPNIGPISWARLPSCALPQLQWCSGGHPGGKQICHDTQPGQTFSYTNDPVNHSFFFPQSWSVLFWLVQVDKVVQMYETMMTRHTTMIVGPTGGGKSVVINTLCQSQTRFLSWVLHHICYSYSWTATVRAKPCIQKPQVFSCSYLLQQTRCNKNDKAHRDTVETQN